MRRRRFRLGLCGASTLLVAAALWLRSSPERVERYFSDEIGPLVAHFLATLSAPLPFSVAELLVAGAALAALGTTGAGLRRLWRGRCSLRETALAALVNVALVALVLWATFYWTWGLNYYRPALPSRVAWPAPASSVGDAEPDPTELTRLAEELVQLANQEYLAALFQPPPEPRRLDQELEKAYPRVALWLDIPSGQFGHAKPLVSSPWLARLGIAGFYSPWTGEAGFNQLVPRSELAHVIAHEKAHQRGIAAEDEANFAGFLACVAADDPGIRYSGLLFAQMQILAELSPRDPALAARLVAERLPGVQKDLDESAEFWSRYRGPLRRVGQALNDSYLRLQGVDEGLASYGRSTRLIVLYARARSGRIPLGPSSANRGAPS